MNDIELNDKNLFKKFNRKTLEMVGKELISIRYYLYGDSDTNYIFFDIAHSTIQIHTTISDVEELNCIIEIGKKLNILKIKQEEEK